MSKKNIGDYKFGNAICYSGYREGQSPVWGIYPTYSQIKEDLIILNKHWDYIRLYDTSQQTEDILKVIREEKLNLKVFLTANTCPEINNPDCPWNIWYTEEYLNNNKIFNQMEIERSIKLANSNKDIIIAVAAGNEASSEFTEHAIPEESIIEYVRKLKANIEQPVSYCEGFYTWNSSLKNLAKEVDFLSVHIYPIWSFRTIDEAMDFTKSSFYSTKIKNPSKPIIITEAGWATKSSSRESLKIRMEYANEDAQKKYFEGFSKWCRHEKIMGFLFEAFDETWKSSFGEDEPERHWGVFYQNRQPKLAIREIYPELIQKDYTVSESKNHNIEILGSPNPNRLNRDRLR